MATRVCKVLPILLTMAILAAPGAPAQVQASQVDIPADLMSALLAASSQPFVAADGGYHTHSGGLDFTLRSDGLQAAAEGIDWGIALSGFGRGEAVAAVSEAEIAQTDGRIEYRRGVLTEWYRDTALGVEQGFTIHQAPGGAGPIVLHLDLNTGLSGSLDIDGRGLSFAALDGQTLRYDHLQAWDADGAELDTSLRYTPGQVALQVNDDGATYPITIDPLMYTEQKVIAPGAKIDYSGYAVTVSGDTALVSVGGDDIGANLDQGSVYVFVRKEATWSLQQKLIASDGEAWDYFGCSVALEGDTALVGVPYGNVGTNDSPGSVYVFVRTGTTWQQQAKLTASDGAVGDHFGRSVALLGDTALVGASDDDIGANSTQGSAYIFTRSGKTWTQRAKLTASDGAAGDNFGTSVALTVGDAGFPPAPASTIALVGVPNSNVGVNPDQGSVYVFMSRGKSWVQRQKLTASNGAAYDCFGTSVAISGDIALVGAQRADVGTNFDQGSGYVFTRNGATWTQQQILTASDGAAEDYFGISVAISGDLALVGAYGDDIDANIDQGSAYIFANDGKTWIQQAKLTASDGAANDRFGVSAAISGDTALAGAYYDDVDANSNQGSAYVFARSGIDWTQEAKMTSSDGEPNDHFGTSVAISGDTALVGVGGDDIGANPDQGSVYIFIRSGTGWIHQAKLTASDGAAGDYFGGSVALGGDTALIGAYRDNVGVNPFQGSAYIFVRSGTSWSQQAKLTASNGAANDGFGVSVAISGDTALVGAPFHAIGANPMQGSAYIFGHNGATWFQCKQLTASDGEANDYFGQSVAISGNTALVGAGADDIGTNFDQGSAYVFVGSGKFWAQQAHLTASDAAAGDFFGMSVSLVDDTALVGAPFNEVGTNLMQGSAYVFVRSGMVWTQQGQPLIASDGAESDHFGYSVAIEDNIALVGAGFAGVGTNPAQGSAYVFTRSGTTWNQEDKLTASDGSTAEFFGISVAISGNTILIGAHYVDAVATMQGAVYFYDFSVLP